VSELRGYRQMGTNMTKKSKCCLCGKEAYKLSKDHIQPSCAFNEKNRKHLRMESVLSLATDRNPPKDAAKVRNIYYEIQPDRPIQGGIYRRTQCIACNGYLGSHYDARFGKWCHDAVGILKPEEIIVVQQEYRQLCRYPLSILKRIVAMFFSINGDRFAPLQPELVDFIMDRQTRKLPTRFGVFAAYTINDIVSHIPFQYHVDVRTGQEIGISQIAHPPFVYVLTIDSACPDPRLTDLTGFARYDYEDEASVEMPFRVVPTNSCLAGDYRPSGVLGPRRYGGPYFRVACELLPVPGRCHLKGSFHRHRWNRGVVSNG
jgi:hypothetical protein